MNIRIMVFPHETKGTIALDKASAASNEAFSTSTVESSVFQVNGHKLRVECRKLEGL